MKKKELPQTVLHKEGDYYFIGSLFGRSIGIICENEEDRNFIASAFHGYFKDCKYVNIKTETNPFLVAMKLYLELEEEKKKQKWYNKLFN